MATMRFEETCAKIHFSEKPITIDLTVVCLVAWPLNESEAGVDLVLIEPPHFFCHMMLFSC